jgi:hypothetical protein
LAAVRPAPWTVAILVGVELIWTLLPAPGAPADQFPAVAQSVETVPVHTVCASTGAAHSIAVPANAAHARPRFKRRTYVMPAPEHRAG